MLLATFSLFIGLGLGIGLSVAQCEHTINGPFNIHTIKSLTNHHNDTRFRLGERALTMFSINYSLDCSYDFFQSLLLDMQ